MKRISRYLCLSVLVCVSVRSVVAQSPYRTSWAKDGYIAGAGVVVGLTSLAVDNAIQPLTHEDVNQLSRESVNSFDRFATYNYSEQVSSASDILVGIIVTTPLALLFDERLREDWSALTLMYLETLTFEGSLLSYAKGGVQRIRPYVYNPDTPLWKKTTAEARRSFFSGHTTMAFASAVFVSTVYGDYFPQSEWRPYIWASTLFAATAVGYLRIEAGAHFPTDVIAGAIVGSAVGYLIPLIHRRDNDNLNLTPTSVGPQTGFIISIRL